MGSDQKKLDWSRKRTRHHELPRERCLKNLETTIPVASDHPPKPDPDHESKNETNPKHLTKETSDSTRVELTRRLPSPSTLAVTVTPIKPK